MSTDSGKANNKTKQKQQHPHPPQKRKGIEFRKKKNPNK